MGASGRLHVLFISTMAQVHVCFGKPHPFHRLLRIIKSHFKYFNVVNHSTFSFHKAGQKSKILKVSLGSRNFFWQKGCFGKQFHDTN